MQFIEGQTLPQAIAERRRSEAPPDSPATTQVARSATPGPSSRNREYFRTAAMLGIQATEALDHAHKFGIIHRDIKPANLLLDAQGNLWITDFGLARLQDDAGLTITGDLLGTLRYMSPEQALAKRGYLDHRTDINSLGAKLYELATLRPAIDGQDRHEVLRKISQDEPAPPRRVNPSIPGELETIWLKAMSKEVVSRYDTAQELADDPRRFLEHRPTNARRPTLAERTAKWTRRHPHNFAWYYLFRLCHDERRTLHGHTGRVYHADFSPDGRTLVSCGQDGTLRFWKGPKTEISPRLPRRPRSSRWTLARELAMWDRATNQVRPTRGGGPIDPNVATFSADATILATGINTRRGIIQMWDLNTLEMLDRLVGHNADITDLDFSPDGRILASLSQDGVVRLWSRRSVCAPAAHCRTKGSWSPLCRRLSMRTLLDRLIPSQPGYAVEVGIVTGEVGETMGLHDRDDQGVASEEFELLARDGRGFQQ